MPLLDVSLLVRLQAEFRLSMKRLLSDLCLDLENQYAEVATSLVYQWPTFGSLAERLSGMPMLKGKLLAGSKR